MAQTPQTPVRLDDTDRKILSLLQQDSSLPLEEVATRIGASRTPVWNRIRRMREQGVIRGQVALLDAESLGLEACFFVLIRTTEHDADWAARFLAARSAVSTVRGPGGARSTDDAHQAGHATAGTRLLVADTDDEARVLAAAVALAGRGEEAELAELARQGRQVRMHPGGAP